MLFLCYLIISSILNPIPCHPTPSPSPLPFPPSLSIGPSDIGQGLGGSHKKSAKGHGLGSPTGLLPAVVVTSPSPAHSPVKSRRAGADKGGHGGKEEDSLVALVDTVNRR